MTEVITTILSNPIMIAVIIILCYSILSLLNKGKIKRIGKDGIELNEPKIPEGSPCSKCGMPEHIQQLENLIREQNQTIKDIELATIRLQILSDSTSLETKLSLFDQYKAKGGNSYIDLYIKQITEQATAKED